MKIRKIVISIVALIPLTPLVARAASASFNEYCTEFANTASLVAKSRDGGVPLSDVVGIIHSEFPTAELQKETMFVQAIYDWNVPPAMAAQLAFNACLQAHVKAATQQQPSGPIAR